MLGFFKKTDDNSVTANKDRTTKTIALVLLYTFIASVAILFVTNIFIENILKKDTSDDFRKGWFDLLKNALVLLGTALTTVIGYYFGQREGNIKAEQAEKKEELANQATQKAVTQKAEEIKEILKNTIPNKSDSLEANDSTAEENNSNIQIP